MNVKNICHAAFRGCFDSFRGMITLFYLDKDINERTLSRLSPTRSNVPIRRNPTSSRESTPSRQLKKHEESKVLRKVVQCCVLNGGIFLFSVILFEYVLLPSLKGLFGFIIGHESVMAKLVWSWIEPILSLLFKTVWVVPLFLLSKIVNALWFQNIADSAYRYSRGRPLFMQSISKLLADSIFSIVIQTLFLIQAMICNYIPIYFVGYTLSMVQMCMLYSLYAFEYKWFNMGWELHKRLDYIETNWPYFIGFGLPLALLTQLNDSWIISACLFSLSFPLFIISGNEASPVTGVCEYHLNFFSPVIAVSNSLFSKTIGLTHKNQPKR